VVDSSVPTIVVSSTLPFWAAHAAAGASAGFFTDTLFYGLDSYKVQRQSGTGQISVGRLFRGILPLAFFGSIPSFAVFFSVYEVTKRKLREQGHYDLTGIFAASVMAGVPSSIIFVPADVLKKVCFTSAVISRARAHAHTQHTHT